MQKEELMLQHRFIELSTAAYQRGIVLFSDFLNLNELNILHTMPKNQLMSSYETFGGYAFSERQMVAFLPDALYYEYNYPIKVLQINPLNKKFAEPLTHRDYLGALLNLGIERCKLGDILIQEETAFLFAHEQLSSFLEKDLSKVRHTSVRMTQTDLLDFHYEPKYECISGSVPSERLDCLISLAFNTSRSKMVPYIEAGKVFVNGKLMTSNGYQPKPGDILSVRGLGRFSYQGILSETKKGRFFIKLHKFI